MRVGRMMRAASTAIVVIVIDCSDPMLCVFPILL